MVAGEGGGEQNALRLCVPSPPWGIIQVPDWERWAAPQAPAALPGEGLLLLRGGRGPRHGRPAVLPDGKGPGAGRR